jgi:hypothetical protein
MVRASSARVTCSSVFSSPFQFQLRLGQLILHLRFQANNELARAMAVAPFDEKRRPRAENLDLSEDPELAALFVPAPPALHTGQWPSRRGASGSSPQLRPTTAVTGRRVGFDCSRRVQTCMAMLNRAWPGRSLPSGTVPCSAESDAPTPPYSFPSASGQPPLVLCRNPLLGITRTCTSRPASKAVP